MKDNNNKGLYFKHHIIFITGFTAYCILFHLCGTGAPRENHGRGKEEEPGNQALPDTDVFQNTFQFFFIKTINFQFVAA